MLKKWIERERTAQKLNSTRNLALPKVTLAHNGSIKILEGLIGVTVYHPTGRIIRFFFGCSGLALK